MSSNVEYILYFFYYEYLKMTNYLVSLGIEQT